MNLTFTSHVVSGHGVGKSLGYPTLNFNVPENFELKPGVYACRLNPFDSPARAGSSPPFHKGGLGGILFFGPRQTFEETKNSLEVHLFDFPEDTEINSATVDVLDHIREPQKFASQEELKETIARDCINARQIFTGKNPNSRLR